MQGCRSQAPVNPPLPQPTSLFTTGYFLGSVLSGPIAGAAPVTAPADALTVGVTFLALENRPASPYAPVGSKAIFFSSSGSGSAVLPAADLTRNATIATDLKFPEDLPATLRVSGSGRITPMATLSGALPAGVTVKFAALDPVTVVDAVTGTPGRRSVEVLVSRPTGAGHAQLALVLKDTARDSSGENGLRTETAVFDLPAADHITSGLVVTFRFYDAISRALAVLVQVSPGSNDPAHVAANTACITSITRQLATSQPTITTGEASAWSTVKAAVQSLTPVKGRRASLAFLADQTGASICEDVAMEADDAVLAELVKEIQAKVSADQSPETDPSVGWLLDHATLQMLSKLSDDAANGTGKISPELTAILTTHTGEAGRHASSIDGVLRGLSTRQELDNRLLAENMIFLEDSSPASRVRAYDWLLARHQAPAGYDPLAPSKARREALEQAAGTQ